MAEGIIPNQLIETSENNVITFTHASVTSSTASAYQFGKMIQISINGLSTSASINNWTNVGSLKDGWRPKTSIVASVSNGGFLYIGTNGDILTLGNFPVASSSASTITFIGK